jgi:hypothetical protein
MTDFTGAQIFLDRIAVSPFTLAQNNARKSCAERQTKTPGYRPGVWIERCSNYAAIAFFFLRQPSNLVSSSK